MKTTEIVDNDLSSSLFQKNLVNQFREKYFNDFLNKFNLYHNINLTKEDIDNVLNNTAVRISEEKLIKAKLFLQD